MLPILAAASSSDDQGVSVPILVVAAGLALVWLLVAAMVLLARRPPRIKALDTGLDLPPESPAVAGLLGSDFVVPGETAPAVLLDLAARRVVDLNEIQPGKTICRVRDREGDALSPVDRRILDALREKAIDGVVPTDALTTGIEDHSKRWHRDLAREVVAEAQAAGLTRNRWSGTWVAALAIGLGVVIATVFAAIQVGGDVGADDEVLVGISVVVIAAVAGFGIVLCGRLSRSLAQLPTDAGREAAARVGGLQRHFRDDGMVDELPPAAVKVRGRHLAYAAALGAATLAVELLPMGAEDDHRAWSRTGGRWRRVRVRYPRFFPPGWGLHPLLALLVAAVVGVVAGFAVNLARSVASSSAPTGVRIDDWDWVNLVGDVLSAVFALGVLWAVCLGLLAIADLFGNREVTGEIVRSRRFVRSRSDNSTRYAHYLAIDDGTDDRLPAFRVRAALWNGHPQGETVTATFTPRLGYVREITRS